MVDMRAHRAVLVRDMNYCANIAQEEEAAVPALFRSRAAHVSLSVLVAVSVSASAYADDAAPAAPPATPPPAAMESGAPLFEGTHFAVLAAFNGASPTLFVAPAIDSLLLGVGLAYEHNENGLAPMSTDKDQATLTLTAAYMLHNRIPFAMGPELALVLPLAPDAFNPVTVVPGWAFLYAPWKAPIAIGTALDIALVFPKSPGKAIIATTTPAVRIVFGFK